MPKIDTNNNELLVTGRGTYIADLAPDDCIDVCFVRSPVPHATIRSVDLGSPQAAREPSSGFNP